MAVTDGWHSLAIGEFEHVAVGPSVVLLRVNGRSSRPRPSPDWRPTLVAEHGTGPERFDALPSPPDAEGVLRAAYSVPAALMTTDARFWLELDDGEIVELGAPAPGTPRRAAPHGAPDATPDAAAAPDAAAEDDTDAGDDDTGAGEAAAQLATLSAALAEARDHATRVQGENETMAATLEELEIWRGELERRLADTTTELAETRARLAQAHATAEMDALVARAEADALEQAARELIDAAGPAQSAD
jgi:hypothetical protein